jgi:hypothetical protein
MATRMQQRRGTAAQWTAANPTLAAGEIGFETDTSKFKMGNGSSAWSALTYFANAAELSAIIDGAPAALNTLNELAAALGDDPAFFTNMAESIADNVDAHNIAINVHGIANTGLLATTANVATAKGESEAFSTAAVTTHNTATTSVHGIADTSALARTADVTTAINSAVGTHSSDTLDVHGIADTSNIVYVAGLTAHNDDTLDVHGIADTAALATKTYADTAVSTHQADTESVHGISNTANLVYVADLTDHSSDTLDVHGITNTGNLAYLSDLTTHSDDTLLVHGIADTSLLATQEYVDSAITTAAVDDSALAGIGIDWNGTTSQYDIDSTVATKTYSDGAVSTHNTATLNVHGIADTSLLALKSEVSAVTKTTIGLGNVDNTADTAKPVSTSQASAIATAKSEAIADATAQVNALLTGAPAALNTLDELAAALGDDANFASTVTTSLGLKVDSLTPISQKTASYTLSSLTERDDLIEMGSATAITLTVPPSSAVDYPIGTSIDILQTGAGQVTIAAGAGVTVNATPGLKLRTTWSSATLFKRAANTWVVFGDLTA